MENLSRLLHYIELQAFGLKAVQFFPSQFDIANVSDCTAYSAAVETDYLNLHEASIFTFLPVSVLVMSLCLTQRCTPTSNDLFFRNAFNSHSCQNLTFSMFELHCEESCMCRV